MRTKFWLLFALTLSASGALLAHDPAFTSEFDRDQCTFSTTGSNPYLPLWPGYSLVLEGVETDAEGDMVEIRAAVTMLPQTELVDGVLTRVMEEREWEDDELIEVSRNFVAHCRETGAVWYFGEDVDIYEGGVIVDHSGAWRAGMNNATAGILMLGTPVIGARYHQELAPGVAEDRAEVTGVDEDVTVPVGTFHNVLEIVDTNPLSQTPSADEKFYAPGVGLIQDESLKLVEIKLPACRPDETTLCLNDGRFQVRANWEDFDRNKGTGKAEQQSGDSGSFWFFGPENTEILVKVLDACGAPAFKNFWVFAGGLTNVDVTLTVVDTKTSQVKVYRNPSGTPFQPVLDTAAFATCP